MNLFKKNLTVGLICSSIFNNVIAFGDTDKMERRIFRPIPETKYQLYGFIQDYLAAVTDNWLKKVPETNPGILDMFAKRDDKPYQSLNPWSGEFAGKYLTGAVQVYRLTGDEKLKETLGKFVDRLVSLQAEDGYLGPWPKDCQLTGEGPGMEGKWTWDIWNHYHVMMGLMLWYEQTEDADALAASKRIGDLLCNKFLGKPDCLNQVGNTLPNLAPIHSLVILYRHTATQKYLDLALQILNENIPRSSDFFRASLKGKDFYQNPGPRWEVFHSAMGLAELFWVTGDNKYKDAYEKIWYSLLKSDRHNTGGSTSQEGAVNNPYDPRAIETCCTIAWSAMSVEMLKLAGNPIVADELELTLFNATLASQSRDGLWSTYNTPMDGARVSNQVSIGGQGKPGCQQFCCCSANAPRGFGILSDWAVMKDNLALILNYYGPSTINTKVKNVPVKLVQVTNYPRTGKILLEVHPESPVEFTLKLRIPKWSKSSQVKVNGNDIEGVNSGSYAAITRKWQKNDTVELNLDMSLHFWLGEKECKGRASIYRGPILLALPRKKINEYVTFDNNWQNLGVVFYGSDKAGAQFKYTFEGDSLVWTGASYDQGGMASVKIDGRDFGKIDQYGQYCLHHPFGKPFRQEYNGLGSGKHEFVVTVLDDKNEKSRGNWVTVFEFVTPKEDPLFDLNKLNPKLLPKDSDDNTIVQVQVQDVNGRKIVLSDFDSAGEKLNPYISWLKIKDFPSAEFSKLNPLRSVRPATD